MQSVFSNVLLVSTGLTVSTVVLCLQAVSYSARARTDERPSRKAVVRPSERRDVYPRRLEGAIRETAA